MWNSRGSNQELIPMVFVRYSGLDRLNPTGLVCLKMCMRFYPETLSFLIKMGYRKNDTGASSVHRIQITMKRQSKRPLIFCMIPLKGR